MNGQEIGRVRAADGGMVTIDRNGIGDVEVGVREGYKGEHRKVAILSAAQAARLGDLLEEAAGGRGECPG